MITLVDNIYVGKAEPDSGGGSAAVIEELNVTPTTSAQVISATSGVDGYAPVNVAAVTSAIDNNIVAGNIKSGVSILGVTGNLPSAETITATNITGGAINNGDKVWINSFNYQAGSTSVASSDDVSHEILMPNGQYKLRITGTSAGGVKYIDVATNTELGSLTPPSAYSASDLWKSTIPQFIIEPDGVIYYCNWAFNTSTRGMQRVDSGLGWYRANSNPVYGSSEYIIDYADSTIKKINPANGNVIKTYTQSGSSYTLTSLPGAYVGNGRFILYTGQYKTATIDENNNTFTMNTIGSISISGYAIGITSDFKYLLTKGNHIYDLTNFPTITDVYSTTLFPATITDYSIIYYNSQTDIYTTTGNSSYSIAPVSAGLTKAVHYDKITGTFTEIPIDFASLVPDTSKYIGTVIGTYDNITGLFYNNVSTKAQLKYLTTHSGVYLVSYNPAVISSAYTQTSIATENIAVGTTGNVTVGAKITPVGTININSNNTYDVTNYASAVVAVPAGITPTGTISITDNGTYDVTNYASASVSVSGGGGSLPANTQIVTLNGPFSNDAYGDWESWTNSIAKMDILVEDGYYVVGAILYDSLGNVLHDNDGESYNLSSMSEYNSTSDFNIQLTFYDYDLGDLSWINIMPGAIS